MFTLQHFFFLFVFFVSNKAFVSQTQNLCQLLMWGFEDGNCRRGGEGEGGETGLLEEPDCFLAFHHVLTLFSFLHWT